MWKSFLIKPFQGHYVLIVDGEIVAHCDTYRECMEEMEVLYGNK